MKASSKIAAVRAVAYKIRFQRIKLILFILLHTSLDLTVYIRAIHIILSRICILTHFVVSNVKYLCTFKQKQNIIHINLLDKPLNLLNYFLTSSPRV